MSNVGGYTGKYFVKKENKEMWYYCLTLGKDINGKRIQKKKRGFSSEREAKKALRKEQALADKGSYILSTNMSYGEYITEWFDKRKVNLGRMTALNNESNIKKHIIPHIGYIKLSDLNALHIETLISTLRDKQLADSTIKKIFSLVSSSLISATKKELVAKNVAALVDNKPKARSKQMKVWNEEEASSFLTLVHNFSTRYYIVFHLALTCGLRQGEILALRWEDIDFNRNTLFVRRSLSHDGLEFTSPKTENSIRSIIFDEFTKQKLKEQQSLLQDEKANCTEYIDLNLVAPTKNGKQVNPNDIDKLWRRLKKLSELPDIRFHDLRHTHASLLLLSNTHPKIVAERLGHSSIQITMDLYSHLFPNMQEDVAKSIGKMLFNNKR